MLAAGTRLGPYEIVGLLGVGGMGEVYHALDTDLGRSVALKLLPAEVAQDPDRLARFDREARILASLSHPHIATIHGLERSTPTKALVLELIDGPTLAERLAAGPLAVDQAVRIARDIGRALDAAHEQGIVHRDLKPANVKLTAAGHVKVLDFGIAKTVGRPDEAATVGLTTAGTASGTVPYMSPEQARGLDVDRRTDIWAFGCVLFEMLTGRRAFSGPTPLDVLTAVIEREPDWNALPAATPPRLRELIVHCLRKDRRDRLRDIGDALHAFEQLETEPAALTAHAPGSRRLVPAAAAIGLAAAAGMAAVLWRGTAAAPDADATAASLGALVQATADDGVTMDAALSADGALLAYASDRAGRADLDVWVQQTAGSVPLRLTEDDVDESQPAFSPDGSRIVYRSERDGGGLYVTQTFGGVAPRLLVTGGRRPQVSPDGRLVAYWTGSNIGFAERPGAYGAFTVPFEGGAPAAIDGFTLARYPVWSPDGRYLLIQGSRDEAPAAANIDWWLVPVGGGEPRPLGVTSLLRATNPGESARDIGPEAWQGDRIYWSDGFVWSARISVDPPAVHDARRVTFGTRQDRLVSVSRDGRLAFSSSTVGSSVFALPLDVERGAVIGPVQRLTPATGYATRPSTAQDGSVMIYVASGPRRSLIANHLRTGRVADLGVTPGLFGPALSPDAILVAFERDRDVAVVPVSGGAPRLLCRECGLGDWTSDGRSVIAVARTTEGGRLIRVDAASGETSDVVVSDESRLDRPFPAPGGRLIAFRSSSRDANVVAVAPYPASGVVPRSSWVSLTPPEGDARPSGWSPSGELLYFVSSRDGTRCLYAQRVDRDSGRPRGNAVAVQHFHGLRNVSGAQGGVLSTGPGNAIRDGRFFYDHAERRSNVWLLSPAAPPVTTPE